MPMTLTGNSKRQREKQNMEDNGFKLINLNKFGIKELSLYIYRKN